MSHGSEDCGHSISAIAHTSYIVFVGASKVTPSRVVGEGGVCVMDWSVKSGHGDGEAAACQKHSHMPPASIIHALAAHNHARRSRRQVAEAPFPV